MRKNNTNRDLAIGRSGENRVVEIFDKLGFPSSLNDCYDSRSEFDIASEFKEQEFHTEVKLDLYANKSGNIAIEVFNPQSGKHSGLNITKAHFWFHIVDKPYLTTVTKLKEYTEKNKPKRIIERGGDGNARLFLYPIPQIIPDIFFPMDESEEFRQLIIALLST